MRGICLRPSRARLWFWGSLLLVAIAAVLVSCQGLPSNVANCPVTPVPPANTSVVPPAQEPPPQALCGFPVQFTSPAVNGQTVTSPALVIATATPPDPIYTLRLYVDGKAVLYSFTTNVHQYVWMANGPHTLEIVAEDTAGYIATVTQQVVVTSQGPGVSGIQNMSNWISCSAAFTSGATCAAGLGVAKSSLTRHQSTPSLDGSATKFSLAGNHAYSNELYWNPLGAGNSVSHFTYDLYFYIDDANAPQSLEFDVNQAFDNTRWTWGTQCDFNQTGKWNVWDDLHGVWVPIPVPCNRFPSKTWIHLVWHFERVGNQVHYIDVDVAGTDYMVDQYYTSQPQWYQEEVDIAFQMDGNYKQQPYNVWLDEVSLDAY